MRRRLRLLAAAAPVCALSWPIAPAMAQVTIDDERTDPIATSTADAGAPADVTIGSSGVLRPAGGTALTIDSDNAVDIQGDITIEDFDDAVGVRAIGGNVGSIIHSGSISITESTEATDDDSDGDLDGARAVGARRVGILIEGSSPFEGDVTINSGSTIAVEGNDSAGVRATAGLTGDFSSSGSFTAIGDDTFGIDLQEGVDGDVTLGGAVIARGENAVGASVMGDVTGAFTSTGSYSASGFRETSRRTLADDRALLDADDLLNGGPAIAIGGSLAEGFYIEGPTGFEGEDDTIPATSVIQSFGSEPAILISAGWDPDRASDVVIAEVPDAGGYGLVHRGIARGVGINDGFSAVAIRIEGANGYRAIVEGGIQIIGDVDAAAYDADAIGLELGAGAETPRIDLSAHGQITATAESGGTDTAVAVAIREDASMSALLNEGVILANAFGNTGDAIAVLDESGSLLIVENRGQIVAYNTLDDDAEGPAGDTTALDLSSATANAVVRQELRAAVNDDDVVSDPSIVGSVLFGSGDDQLIVVAGTLDGDIDFGAGADSLFIDGGAEVTGALSDSDGGLAIDVASGTLTITSTGAHDLASLDLGADARLAVTIDLSTGEPLATQLVVAGEANIAEGAEILPQLTGVAAQEVAIELINAGVLNAPDDIAEIIADGLPFLYDAALSRDPDNADIVLLSLERRSAEALGLNANQTAAYDAVLTALTTDEELGAAIVNIAERDDFLLAYDQLLPDYAEAALQLASANASGAFGAVANRLDVVRAQRAGSGGVWLQEYGAFVDREDGVDNSGFRGHGFGVAVGVDRPIGPFYAVGVNLAGSSFQWEQATSFDDPVSALSAQAGVYAAASAGNFLFDIYGGGGADFYDATRNIQIGDVVRSTNAEWTGYHAAASVRAGYEINAGPLVILPTVSLDYLMLEEEGYEESGGGAGVDLEVGDRSWESVASTAMLTVGGRFNRAGRTWWSPRLRVGYRAELSGEPALTTARFIGSEDYFTLRPEELPDSGGIAGFTFAAGSQYSAFSFDYDADIREGFVRHVARVAFRFVF